MKTLLVIDPTEGNRDLVATLFSSPDVDVLTAGTAREGIDLALREIPDLIITEFMIPRASGHCVVEELNRHAELDGVPVIVWAEDAIGDAEARTKVAGGRFLPKNTAPLVFLNEVNRALGLTTPAGPAPTPGTGTSPQRPVVA